MAASGTMVMARARKGAWSELGRAVSTRAKLVSRAESREIARHVNGIQPSKFKAGTRISRMQRIRRIIPGGENSPRAGKGNCCLLLWKRVVGTRSNPQNPLHPRNPRPPFEPGWQP